MAKTLSNWSWNKEGLHIAHETLLDEVKACVRAAAGRLGRHIAHAAENKVWLARSQLNDMSERNLSFHLANALHSRGYSAYFEVDPGRSEVQRIDLIAVNWRTKRAVMAEAKLLYGSSKAATSIASDMEKLDGAEPRFWLKSWALPGKASKPLVGYRVARLVLASTWTLKRRGAGAWWATGFPTPRPKGAKSDTGWRELRDGVQRRKAEVGAIALNHDLSVQETQQILFALWE